MSKDTRITVESQVSLTVELPGRIKPASNSFTKKEEKLKKYIEKAGKKWFSRYNEPSYHAASHSLLLSDISYLISIDGKPGRIPPSTWKKMSNTVRLETQLQITADYLAGIDNAKFTYEVLN